jgi:hypothetical protein
VVVVTTPVRVSGWKATLRRQRDAQFIVFDAEGEASKSREGDPHESSFARGSCLVIDGREDALASLTRRWEQFCHDGWSHN